ncbi:hypothetical protein LJB95_02935, partial [Paludibacteraceae bacterium OttesenSCG-928-F17]|nr:hypothetical protein [Paludibacteraceae bacterium OttesenSCG-928-F17]
MTQHNLITKNVYLKIYFILFLVLFLTGCSTKRNTWLSRNYHSMTTKFNVGFNGNESYKEGMKNILDANEDDYSTVL